MIQQFSVICGSLSPDSKLPYRCLLSLAERWMAYRILYRSAVCKLLLSLLLLLDINPSQAFEPVQYKLSTAATVGTGSLAPFWFHQGTDGTRLYKANAFHLDARLQSDYLNPDKILEIGYGMNTVFRAASDTADVIVSELYFKTRLYFLELLVGSRPVRTGIEYEPLSSGGMLFSGNALPMPGLTAGFNRFVSVPFTFNMLQLKGAISHSYFTDHVGFKNVMLHHKYVHFQLGKPLPVRLQYRFDHVAQWGGKSLIPGQADQPSSFDDLKSIFMVKSGNETATPDDQVNVLGNHLIGQSLKMEVETNRWLMTAYWQQILEDKPFRFMGYTMNSPDGLWGITFSTKKNTLLQTVLYEYVSTTDQSGPYHDRDGIIYGGGDNYFVGFYPGGWTHHSHIIGTPFVKSPVFNPGMSIKSLVNRFKAHHIGLEGACGNWSYRIKASFMKSYAGNLFNGIPITQVQVHQQRYYFAETSYSSPRWEDYSLGLALGIDRGTHTGNASGIQVSLRRSGFFH